MSHPLEIRALGERAVVVRRVFDAPRTLVFEAWTRPELLQRWLGVFGPWTLPICEVDLRVGGAYRFVWRGAGGAEMCARGVYKEIVPPERLVTTERFDDPWYPGEALNTLVLEEAEGRTVCTLTMLYATTEARDAVLASPMEHGLEKGFQGLDGVLAGGAGAATPGGTGPST